MLWALAFLPLAMLQPLIRKVVIEGINTNVDILCNLGREFYPQYWEIEGRVYDLYRLPEIFSVSANGGIRIKTIDRRMHDWRLKCFSIDPTSETDLIEGTTTVLNVVVLDQGKV